MTFPVSSMSFVNLVAHLVTVDFVGVGVPLLETLFARSSPSSLHTGAVLPRGKTGRPNGRVGDFEQRIDPAGPEAPLFREPGSNRPLRVSKIRATVKKVATAAGLNPDFFGAHSLR